MFNLFRNPCPIGAEILLQTNSAKERDGEVSQGFMQVVLDVFIRIDSASRSMEKY